MVRERSGSPLNPTASIPRMLGLAEDDSKRLKQQAKLIKSKALQILGANFIVVNPFDAPIDRIAADVRHNIVHVMAKKTGREDFLANLAELLPETVDRHAVTFSSDEFGRLEPIVYNLTNNVRTLGGNTSGGDVFERVQYDMREGLELKYAIGIATVLALSYLLSKPARNEIKDVAAILQNVRQRTVILETDKWYMVQVFDHVVWDKGMPTVATERKRNADFFKILAKVRGVINDEYNKYGTSLVGARIITPSILQLLRSLRNDVDLTHSKQKPGYNTFDSTASYSSSTEEARKLAAYDRARQITENLARTGMGNLGRTVTTLSRDQDSDVNMTSGGGGSSSSRRVDDALARRYTTTTATTPSLKTRIGPGVY